MPYADPTRLGAPESMQTADDIKPAALLFPTRSTGRLIFVAQTPTKLEMSDIPSPEDCKTSATSRSRWDVTVAVLLVVGGCVILVLLYYVLLLRHKLHVAQAGNALEYFGFYHMARYSLKDLQGPPEPPTITPMNTPEVSDTPRPLSLDVPPPSLHLRPPLASLVVPPPPPFIYTTPPSPRSDADVYSSIRSLRPTRLSAVSQTQVVLFEHSSF